MASMFASVLVQQNEAKLEAATRRLRHTNPLTPTDLLPALLLAGRAYPSCPWPYSKGTAAAATTTDAAAQEQAPLSHQCSGPRCERCEMAAALQRLLRVQAVDHPADTDPIAPQNSNHSRVSPPQRISSGCDDAAPAAEASHPHSLQLDSEAQSSGGDIVAACPVPSDGPVATCDDLCYGAPSSEHTAEAAQAGVQGPLRVALVRTAWDTYTFASDSGCQCAGCRCSADAFSRAAWHSSQAAPQQHAGIVCCDTADEGGAQSHGSIDQHAPASFNAFGNAQEAAKGSWWSTARPRGKRLPHLPTYSQFMLLVHATLLKVAPEQTSATCGATAAAAAWNALCFPPSTAPHQAPCAANPSAGTSEAGGDAAVSAVHDGSDDAGATAAAPPWPLFEGDLMAVYAELEVAQVTWARRALGRALGRPPSAAARRSAASLVVPMTEGSNGATIPATAAQTDGGLSARSPGCSENLLLDEVATWLASTLACGPTAPSKARITRALTRYEATQSAASTDREADSKCEADYAEGKTGDDALSDTISAAGDGDCAAAAQRCNDCEGVAGAGTLEELSAPAIAAVAAALAAAPRRAALVQAAHAFCSHTACPLQQG